MKVLIVEDETSAYENLKAILMDLYPDIEIAGNTQSVAKTAEWLQEHGQPDLIFMDIHLSDDSAFALFERMEVDIPVIFTTAYDQYAIEAFRVNSIDYLLKPVKAAEVKRAVEKYRRLDRSDISRYLSRLTELSPSKRGKERILIPYRDKLMPVALKDISFFYTNDRNTTVYLKNGHTYPYTKTLEQITKELGSDDFFRANKQFLIRRDSVADITVWFDSRLLVTLDTTTPEHLYISKNRAAAFKEWMMQGG
ncbi:MAG: response regulator transcription factor [Alistipes sp.]|nr:response regulator transcription factor [Alistipes sp.]